MEAVQEKSVAPGGGEVFLMVMLYLCRMAYDLRTI